MKTTLGAVAHECRNTWNGDKTGVPVVGLEHLEPGEVILSSWEIDSDNTFTKKFTKGQVLLGRRRVYLRKAVLAPVDGICSGDITVIEANPDKLLPELLPFIIQNDAFFNFAMKGSAGSLSPRVKWEHLKDYEISLPTLAEQRKLADRLWAAYHLKESYKRLLAATDEMVKSQFIEMFGTKEYPTKAWGDLFETKLGKMLDKNKQNSNDHTCSYLANINVQWGCFDMRELNQMTFTDSELDKFALKEGDLLICEGGEAGRCAVWKLNDSKIKFQKAIHRARSKTSEISVYYAQYYLHYAKEANLLSDYITKGTIEHLTGQKLNTIPIPLPPMSLQQQFVSITEQADKSKFELREAIKRIDDVMKALMN